METYRRDFTIGERETQRFYRMLTLRKWSRGILTTRFSTLLW